MRKPKTGRPPKDINPRHVERMAAIGCTNVEIADVLGCDEGTIRKRFAEILTKARATMREQLRRAQWRAAIGGDRTMLIWLGKNMLGQQDHQSISIGELQKRTDEELIAIAAGKLPA